MIDTQGAKGELQRSAAMAADMMISPLFPGMIEYAEFHTGTLEMLAALNVMGDFSSEFRSGPLALVINGMNRTAVAKMIATQIRIDFRAHPTVRLLDTVVPNTKAYPESRVANMPVHRYDDAPRRVSKTPSGNQVMHELVWELFPWLKDMTVGGTSRATSVATVSPKTTTKSDSEGVAL